MPKFGSRVEVEDKFDEFIDATENGIEDFIEEAYDQTVREGVSNMSTGRDAMGRPWQPTQDPEDDTPLVDTGRMMRSIRRVSRITARGRAAVFSAGPDYVDIHEFGAPDAGIPKRPFLLPMLEYAVTEMPEWWNKHHDERVEATLMD